MEIVINAESQSFLKCLPYNDPFGCSEIHDVANKPYRARCINIYIYIYKHTRAVRFVCDIMNF